MIHMRKIGLFYGTEATKTSTVAQQIQEAFGKNIVDIVPIEKAWKDDFEAYDQIIAGTSTWFDGELPTYWDEIVPELTHLDLTDKIVALFGLGNQKEYPDNFVDGIGILADIFRQCGATLIGFTSPEGYHFTHSKALLNGKFQGLALDLDNQAAQTSKRIQQWVEQLEEEFEENAPD